MSSQTTLRSVFTVTSLALLVAAGALGAKRPKPERRSIEYLGQERSFHLFVPEHEEDAGPMPLLLLLHGSGRDGMSLMDKWYKLAATEGIVVAAPESLDPKVWIAPADGPDFLRDVVESLKAELPIDPARVYLFGHSGGASFSLQMAVAEPRYFAAAAVHAGRLHEEAYPLADEAKRKIPIKIVVGTRDRFFPLDRVRATRDALAERDFPIDLTEIPGHDHWYYDMAPRINRQCWEFLKEHRLEGDPEYVQYRFE